MAEKLLTDNPFAHLCGRAPEPDDDWYFVDRDEFTQLLTGCKNVGWRVFLALQRWGGLRRQEAYDLPVSNVDLERKQIKVVGKKVRRTSRKGHIRFVPMNNDLEQIVVEAVNDLEPGEQFIVSPRHVGANNWETRLRGVAKRAGMSLWAEPFQCLRRSRATELADAGVPQHVHCDILGHSTEIADKYYLKVQQHARELARAV